MSATYFFRHSALQAAATWYVFCLTFACWMGVTSFAPPWGLAAACSSHRYLMLCGSDREGWGGRWRVRPWGGWGFSYGYRSDLGRCYVISSTRNVSRRIDSDSLLALTCYPYSSVHLCLSAVMARRKMIWRRARYRGAVAPRDSDCRPLRYPLAALVIGRRGWWR